MKPKKLERSDTDDLFRARLENIIDLKHPLVRLARETDWAFFEAAIEPLYAEDGRPGVPVRFMVGLHILKHTFNLSDEKVCAQWVENPYFQYFTGEEYFRHEFPHERSVMSRWRERVSEQELARLLQESLRIAHKTGAVRTEDLKRVTVDTTVQPKAITFPTDAKLIYRAIVRLGALARRHGVKLRQSYVRVGKLALIKSQRYAHAKQFRRHRRQLKFLRIRLGRVIRDIAREVRAMPAWRSPFATSFISPVASAINSGDKLRRRSIRCTRPKWNASAKARRTNPTSSAARSRSLPPTRALRAASSSSTSPPCTAILMMAIRSTPRWQG